MKKKVILDWIAALRSGEYEQGIEALAIPAGKYDKFCCLGVLCDLYAVELDDDEVGFDVSPIDDNALAFYTGSTHELYYLPNIVAKYAGLTATQEDKLVRMNDTGSSFDEIATQLETWLKKGA